MLPNDTDLTPFREIGNIEGFNFAFIDDHFNSHTALDNIDRVDPRAIKHQGSYLMPLLNYFSEADLSVLKSENNEIIKSGVKPILKTVSIFGRFKRILYPPLLE